MWDANMFQMFAELGWVVAADHCTHLAHLSGVKSCSTRREYLWRHRDFSTKGISPAKSAVIIGPKFQGRVPADIRVGPHETTRRRHAGLHHPRRRPGHGHTSAIRRHHERVLKAAPWLRQPSPSVCGTRHRGGGVKPAG